MARVALCDNPNWAPLSVLLGLVSCSVPIPLKAELLLTLAALAKTPSTAATLWHNLEASQILTTVPSTSSYQPRGIQVSKPIICKMCCLCKAVSRLLVLVLGLVLLLTCKGCFLCSSVIARLGLKRIGCLATTRF